jgi:hypothetical protein
MVGEDAKFAGSRLLPLISESVSFLHDINKLLCSANAEAAKANDGGPIQSSG